MERAKQTRVAIIVGQSLQGMVNAGNANATSVWNEILAGLTRDQDRLALGLDPLPGSDSAVKPVSGSSASDPMADAVARRSQAIKAWEGEKSEQNRIRVGQAMAACEKLTGKVWEHLPLDQRLGWGLGDSPGELRKDP